MGFSIWNGLASLLHIFPKALSPAFFHVKTALFLPCWSLENPGYQTLTFLRPYIVRPVLGSTSGNAFLPTIPVEFSALFLLLEIFTQVGHKPTAEPSSFILAWDRRRFCTEILRGNR